MQAALRAALAGDLAALKAAVQLYKEQVARLQCQKQLLLSQAGPIIFRARCSRCRKWFLQNIVWQLRRS